MFLASVIQKADSNIATSPPPPPKGIVAARTLNLQRSKVGVAERKSGGGDFERQSWRIKPTSHWQNSPEFQPKLGLWCPMTVAGN